MYNFISVPPSEELPNARPKVETNKKKIISHPCKDVTGEVLARDTNV